VVWRNDDEQIRHVRIPSSWFGYGACCDGYLEFVWINWRKSSCILRCEVKEWLYYECDIRWRDWRHILVAVFLLAGKYIGACGFYFALLRISLAPSAKLANGSLRSRSRIHQPALSSIAT